MVQFLRRPAGEGEDDAPENRLTFIRGNAPPSLSVGAHSICWQAEARNKCTRRRTGGGEAGKIITLAAKRDQEQTCSYGTDDEGIDRLIFTSHTEGSKYHAI